MATSRRRTSKKDIGQNLNELERRARQVERRPSRSYIEKSVIDSTSLGEGSVTIDNLDPALAAIINTNSNTFDTISLASEDLLTSLNAANETSNVSFLGADGKTQVYYQSTAPTSDGRVPDDLWYDTDADYKPYRWGFESVSITSVVVSGASAPYTAVLTTSAAHTLAVGNYITITGLSAGIGLNDVSWEISNTSTASPPYTFTITGITTATPGTYSSESGTGSSDNGAWLEAPFGDAALASLTVGKLLTGTLRVATVATVGDENAAGGTGVGGSIVINGGTGYTGIKLFKPDGTNTVFLNALTGNASFTGTISASAGSFTDKLTIGVDPTTASFGDNLNKSAYGPRELGIKLDAYNYWTLVANPLSVTLEGLSPVFYIGSADTNKPDYLEYDIQGDLTVSGTVFAVQGSDIGGWSVGNGLLYAGSGATYTAMSNETGSIPESGTLQMANIIVDDEFYFYFDPSLPTDLGEYSTIYITIPYSSDTTLGGLYENALTKYEGATITFDTTLPTSPSLTYLQGSSFSVVKVLPGGYKLGTESPDKRVDEDFTTYPESTHFTLVVYGEDASPLPLVIGNTTNFTSGGLAHSSSTFTKTPNGRPTKSSTSGTSFVYDTVTYTTTTNHNYVEGEFVTVTGFTGTYAAVFNKTSAEITSVTTNTFTVANAYKTVKLASAASVTTNPLAGLLTLDGVVTVSGDRVLIKNHTTASLNGIWVVASGNWTRATDFDQAVAGEVATGATVRVTAGNTLANTTWVLTTTGTITVGTTSLTFTQPASPQSSSGTGTITNLNIINISNGNTLPNPRPGMSISGTNIPAGPPTTKISLVESGNVIVHLNTPTTGSPGTTANSLTLGNVGDVSANTTATISYDTYVPSDSGYFLWAGSEDPTTSVLSIKATGELIATDANITGIITATSGTIGGFSIGTDTLSAGSSSTYVTVSSGTTAFSAGGGTPASAPFNVSRSGVLTATSGTIGGWSLSATTINQYLLGTNKSFLVELLAPTSLTSNVNYLRSLAYNDITNDYYGQLNISMRYDAASATLTPFINIINKAIVDNIFSVSDGLLATQNIYIYARTPNTSSYSPYLRNLPSITFDGPDGAIAGMLGAYNTKVFGLESLSGEVWVNIDDTSLREIVLGTSVSPHLPEIRVTGSTGDVKVKGRIRKSANLSKYYASADRTALTGQFSNVNFNTEDISTTGGAGSYSVALLDGTHNGVAGTNNIRVVRVPHAGYYHIFGKVRFESNATGLRQVRVCVFDQSVSTGITQATGTLLGSFNLEPIETANNTDVVFSVIATLDTASDRIVVWAYQDSGSTLNVLGGDEFTQINVVYLGEVLP